MAAASRHAVSQHALSQVHRTSEYLQSAGLMAAQFSSMVKRLHAGKAAQSGVYSALLAQRGYVGIGDIFENDYGGYCATFSPKYDLTQLTRGLGQTWETRLVGFKPYSANGSCHPCIDALLDLMRQESFGPGDVVGVTFNVSSATKEHVGWPYTVSSVTTAQMNLSYIAAVVLTDGDAFVDQFTAERIADPALVALADRVRVVADPGIDAKGDAFRHSMRVTVHLSDGRVLGSARDFARGSERAPLTDAELVEKFFKLASKSVSREEAEAFRHAIACIEEAPSGRAFAESLATAR
jgi:aconitate decarboxylase